MTEKEIIDLILLSETLSPLARQRAYLIFDTFHKQEHHENFLAATTDDGGMVLSAEWSNGKEVVCTVANDDSVAFFVAMGPGVWKAGIIVVEQAYADLSTWLYSGVPEFPTERMRNWAEFEDDSISHGLTASRFISKALENLDFKPICGDSK